VKNIKILVLIAFLILTRCDTAVNEKGILIYNLNEHSEEEKSNFLKLKLDDNYPNLLNPEISEENLKEVYESWKKLHVDLYRYLNKNNFEWEATSEKIKIFNKFYFTKEGEIEFYVFKILNDVSQEKVSEYENLVQKFSKNIQISLKRDFKFAQCGKASLPNKSRKL
jgi:hypothetical protein